MGSGYISKVKKGVHKGTGKTYAVKIMSMSKLSNGERRALKRELDTHRCLDHDNIVKLYNSFEVDGSLYIILEHIEMGNLYHFIKEHTLAEDEVVAIFYQVASALSYLHGQNILHRDVKPENILMVSRSQVKLCDFGFCAPYGNDEVR